MRKRLIFLLENPTYINWTLPDKIPDLSKYFITPEFNKLTAKTFTARLAQANLASKNNIAYFVKRC